MLSFVVPTRNRPDRLGATLDALGRCVPPPGGGEVFVVDNGSDAPARAPRVLANGLGVFVVRRPRNEGAAGRNAGVRAADPGCEWVVMLDDDSHPEPGADLVGLVRRLIAQPRDVVAVMADIRLPREARRESGGLPEVFVGCGVALRRGAFLDAGGYDARFGYYAEEYDLAAKLLLAGGRVGFDPAFRVVHHKTAEGRDLGLILARLVRNTSWVAQRYAPESERRAELRRVRRRYRSIAAAEGVVGGFAVGLRELRDTIVFQRRTPMPAPLWDRFTGLGYARRAILSAHRREPFDCAMVVEPGRNEWAVRRALAEAGVRETGDAREAQAAVVGTLSPGPMLDAAERWRGRGVRVVVPWEGAEGIPAVEVALGSACAAA